MTVMINAEQLLELLEAVNNHVRSEGKFNLELSGADAPNLIASLVALTWLHPEESQWANKFIQDLAASLDIDWT